MESFAVSSENVTNLLYCMRSVSPCFMNMTFEQKLAATGDYLLNAKTQFKETCFMPYVCNAEATCEKGAEEVHAAVTDSWGRVDTEDKLNCLLNRTRLCCHGYKPFDFARSKTLPLPMSAEHRHIYDSCALGVIVALHYDHPDQYICRQVDALARLIASTNPADVNEMGLELAVTKTFPSDFLDAGNPLSLDEFKYFFGNSIEKQGIV